jgi:hypothetical protein
MKAGILIGVVVASCLAGCSQRGDGQRSAARQSQTVPEVDTQSCVTQAQDCAWGASSPSALAGCQQTLQTCLADAMTKAGLPVFVF